MWGSILGQALVVTISLLPSGICSAAMVAWCSYNFIYILAESKNICILQFKESYIVKNGVALFAIAIDVL